ncbi:twin-arginine translocase subunit TatC [Thermostilla marina]
MIRLFRPPRSDEDLFRESTMTFGEHLEELRTCLFRALLGLGVGFCIGLLFGNQVVQIIQMPLQKALTKHYLRQSQKEIDERITQLEEAGTDVPFDVEAAASFLQRENLLVDEFYITPGEIAPQLEESLATLQKQLAQKRGQLAAAINVLGTPADSWSDEEWNTLNSLPKLLSAGEDADADQLTAFGKCVEAKRAPEAKLLRTIQAAANARIEKVEEELRRVTASLDAWGELTDVYEDSLRQLDTDDMMHVFVWRKAEKDPRVKAKSLGAHEAFSIYMRASLLVGALLAAPWIFWQIWSFVASGLYRHERKFVYTFLPFSLVLFTAGAMLAFLFVFEPVLTFLFRFNEWMGIELEPRISEWLRFVLVLPLGFGIGFQLPLVMLFLERIGIFTVDDYWSKWRIAVVVVFVTAALLTPPDPSSQMMMAVPLSCLYFGGILLCKFMPRRKTEYTDA